MEMIEFTKHKQGLLVVSIVPNACAAGTDIGGDLRPR